MGYSDGLDMYADKLQRELKKREIEEELALQASVLPFKLMGWLVDKKVEQVSPQAIKNEKMKKLTDEEMLKRIAEVEESAKGVK